MTTDTTDSMQNGADRRRRGKRGEASAPGVEQAEQPFEAQLEELDRIVNSLEEGRLPLEDALTLYERGMRLAKACQERLNAAELRVRRLRVIPSPDGGDELDFTLDEFEPAA